MKHKIETMAGIGAVMGNTLHAQGVAHLIRWRKPMSGGSSRVRNPYSACEGLDCGGERQAALVA
ncbi:MAG: hypothetical protein ING16_14415 [Roseomonas sp.]|jgi:hypothetical protein|nr:hypothetical protein [Roseomonas sp.]MCA3284054.1 hypothetical protein [Roseomonas sp.]